LRFVYINEGIRTFVQWGGGLLVMALSDKKKPVTGGGLFPVTGLSVWIALQYMVE